MNTLHRLAMMGGEPTSALTPDAYRLAGSLGELATKTLLSALSIKNGFHAFASALHGLSDDELIDWLGRPYRDGYPRSSALLIRFDCPERATPPRVEGPRSVAPDVLEILGREPESNRSSRLDEVRASIASQLRDLPDGTCVSLRVTE